MMWTLDLFIDVECSPPSVGHWFAMKANEQNSLPPSELVLMPAISWKFFSVTHNSFLRTTVRFTDRKRNA